MKHVWLIQCNQIENTDMIYIFTSEKKALKWLEDNQEYEDNDNENYPVYSEPEKTVLNPL